MKIFVTGGTGVVGTRAIPALVAAGHDVTAVARSDGQGRAGALDGCRTVRLSTCSTPTP